MRIELTHILGHKVLVEMSSVATISWDERGMDGAGKSVIVFSGGWGVDVLETPDEIEEQESRWLAIEAQDREANR